MTDRTIRKVVTLQLIRQVVGERAKEHKAASTSQMGRFETEVLNTVRELTGTHGFVGNVD